MYLLGFLIVDQLFFGSINNLDFTNNLALEAITIDWTIIFNEFVFSVFHGII